ncbi:MAG TPA: hypothetical protein PK095_04615, partial [Myxococcota bacterium]|nr:hypothetical protein [Myxococcota bacterium]
MDAILDEHGLAQLLKATDKTLASLLARSDLPRFTLAGEKRFLASSVLAWIARHEGSELIPAELAPVEAPPVVVVGEPALPEPTPAPAVRPRPILS